MRTIPTTVNRYGDGLESPTIHVAGLEGTHFSLCSVHVVPEGSEGRQVHGGPLVPGPWPFVCTHALVIDNHGGSAAERDRALRFEVGEPFRIEGNPGVWAFRSPNRRRAEGDGPQLERLED